MYLEATISFWEDQMTPEGKDIRRKTNYHVLCHCVNYTDCEAMATEHGLEITTESFDVGPIIELKISEVYSEEGHDSYPWFKCTCSYAEFMENGKAKDRKRNILVQAKDSSEASVKATKLTEEWCDSKNVRTPKVSETLIQTILKES